MSSYSQEEIEFLDLLRELLKKNFSSGGGSTFTSDIVVSLTGGKTLGRFTNGQTISAVGKTAEEVLNDIATEYLSPSFTSFSISGQSTLIEVGTALSGTKTFLWGTSNSSNIQANSISIIDVTASSNLATGLTNDGSEVLNIGTITNTSPITQQWRARGINTQASNFDSSLFTVNSIYPIFYGKSSTPPTANQALIDGGIKSVVQSTGTVNITFGASSEYLWFAIPQSSTNKTKWYVDALNNGNIGTGSDLFNANTIVSINSPSSLWSAINYRIYISNFATTTSGNMELRNS